MLIDWFTVLAQILNFLILIFLLRRFLYGPILAAITERESRLAKIQSDALLLKEQAQNEKNEYQFKIQKFEDEKKNAREQLINELNRNKEQSLEELEKNQNSEREKIKKTLQRGKELLIKSILKKTQKEALVLSAKILTDISSQTLQNELFLNLIKRIESFHFEDGQKDFLKESCQFVSAWPLSTHEQSQIYQILTLKAGFEFSLTYIVKSELIAGFELCGPSFKVSWNFVERLNFFEQQLDGLIT